MIALDEVFAVSPSVRYVALYHDGQLTSRQRADLMAASASESDRYEELIVNPTVLTAVRQRGNIDCGGLDYVVIRYRSFFEFVQPLARSPEVNAADPFRRSTVTRSPSPGRS